MFLYYHRENFGDNLAPYIVSKILPSEYLYWAKPFRFKRFFMDAIRFIAYPTIRDLPTSSLLSYEFNKKILISVGSIIEEANKNTVVWGAGVSHKDSYISAKSDIRAVRGYRTIERMRQLGIDTDGVAVGDPAVLLPDLYSPNMEKKNKFGIIPHKSDFDEVKFRFRDLIDSNEIVVISLRDKDVEATIREIASCDMVISTSLHGLIVAHAYSVPALWAENKPLIGDRSKFFDYFSALGIAEYKQQNLEYIESLLRNDEAALIEIIQEFGKIPDKEKSKSVRDSLLNAFPFDVV